METNFFKFGIEVDFVSECFVSLFGKTNQVQFVAPDMISLHCSQSVPCRLCNKKMKVIPAMGSVALTSRHIGHYALCDECASLVQTGLPTRLQDLLVASLVEETINRGLVKE